MRNSKRRLLSLALALAVVVGTFSACNNGKNGASTPAAGSNAGSSTAKKDSLVVATANETPSMHPYDHNATAGGYMNILTHNGLFRTGMDLVPVPDLVETFENVSATEWTFKIHKGIKFHDGSIMTAEDVKASLDYAKQFTQVGQYTKSIAKVDVVDPLTVKITTKGPSASLLSDLAHHGNNIVPKALIDSKNDFNKNPIGSGPYKFVKWTLGDKVEFVKFDEYFDKERAATIKDLTWKIIPEGASRTIALEAGEIDLIIEVESMDVARLKSDSKVTIIDPPSTNHNFLMLNNEVAPFNNPLVRKALNAAIDKVAVAKVALNGLGSPSISQTPMGLPGHSDKNGDVYNPELAKKYLKDSGVDPATIKLPIICSDDTKKRAGEVVQANLNEVLGVKAEIVSMDLATYLSQTAEGKYVAAIGGYTSSTMVAYVQGVWHSTSINASNKTRLNNKAVDTLIDKAASTIDQAERTKVLVELSELLNTLCPQIPLYQPLQIRAFNSKLSGIEVNASATMYLNMARWN